MAAGSISENRQAFSKFFTNFGGFKNTTFRSMKKIFFAMAAAILWVATAGAQTQTAAPQKHLDPTVAAIGKEPARGNVVSYPSRDQALRGADPTTGNQRESAYLQPLTEWTRTETADSVIFKTRFKVPFSWIDRQQFLYMERVSGSFSVTVNGREIGYSQTGSTPAEFDVTAASREGNNDLQIAVYKHFVGLMLESDRPVSAPAIEGETYIFSQPRMRVRDIFVDTRMEGTNGLLQLGVIMKSHRLNARKYLIYYELLSPRGEILAEGHREATLEMKREDTVRFFAKIRDITPWSHEKPQIYTLLVRTQNDGRFGEYLSFPVGFRRFEFLPETGQMLLNDRQLALVARDFQPVLPLDAAGIARARREIEELQAQGINTLRVTGSPPGQKFYDLCDELGVYVCLGADINTRGSGLSRRLGGNPTNDPAWAAAYYDRALAAYHTSKNHPSTAVFSLAAESANGYNLYENYLMLKKLEPLRPVIYEDGGEWNSDRIRFASEGEKITNYDLRITQSEAPSEEVRKFVIDNPNPFVPLLGEAEYQVVTGSKTVAKGTIPLRVVPGGSAEIEVPTRGTKSGAKSTGKSGKKFRISLEIKVEKATGKYVPAEGETAPRVLRDSRPNAAYSPISGLPEEQKITLHKQEFEF